MSISGSIAGRFVSELRSVWFRGNRKAPENTAPAAKNMVRRTVMRPKPSAPFKPKPVNPDQYSSHL